MLRKKELIKKIQKEFQLSSYRVAEEHYDKFMKVLKDGLDEADAIKIPKIGIVRKVLKKAKAINVPTKSELVHTKDRVGLAFKEDDIYKNK